MNQQAYEQGFQQRWSQLEKSAEDPADAAEIQRALAQQWGVMSSLRPDNPSLAQYHKNPAFEATNPRFTSSEFLDYLRKAQGPAPGTPIIVNPRQYGTYVENALQQQRDALAGGKGRGGTGSAAGAPNPNYYEPANLNGGRTRGRW